jgi:hypothetical protein
MWPLLADTAGYAVDLGLARVEATHLPLEISPLPDRADCWDSFGGDRALALNLPEYPAICLINIKMKVSMMHVRQPGYYGLILKTGSVTTIGYWNGHAW